MEEPRLVTRPPIRVLRRWYRGERPPAPAFFAHWRNLNAWARAAGIESSIDGVAMVGYEPPGGPGVHDFVYAACLPVTAGTDAPDDTVDAGELPGGRFVLCAGDLTELPELYKAAKRYAVAQGLAFERGGIEIFRPDPANPATYRVEAGCRIHD